MSFHVSSNDIRIRVEPGKSTFLICKARDAHGNWHDNEIRLDDFIGNTDGESTCQLTVYSIQHPFGRWIDTETLWLDRLVHLGRTQLHP